MKRFALLTLFVVASCANAAEEPTFNADIAPIVYKNCTPCHRPGGEAPFKLDSYEAVQRSGRQIGIVVASGYMPPWLPQPTDHPFADQRGLTEQEKQTIQRWVNQGMPQGDGDAPAAPTFASGWRLGEPDWVIELPEAFTLRADGDDLYRNFVLPTPLPSGLWVGAIEFDPGNRRAVHHARILVDPTDASRRRDEAQPGVGYDGMSPGDAAPPDGRILGWAPGKVAKRHDEAAWRLEPGVDLVLQLHLVPTGKPETIQPRIALYAAPGPPARRPYSLLLGTREIDLPAGANDVAVEDDYTIPVDVELAALYPHAHYLAREMQLEATLPDGASRRLLQIDEWDFDWQDDYWFADPVALPAGTTLTMRYRYDNSADNVRNPSNPPRRVRYGAESTDEMAEMLIQLVTTNDEDRAKLVQDNDLHTIAEALEWRKQRFQEAPDEVDTWIALGNNYVQLGRFSEGLQFLRRATRAQPENSDLWVNVGWANERLGQSDRALRAYGKALASDADHAEALAAAGRLLRTRPEGIAQAIALHRRLVERRPREASAHRTLAESYRSAGEFALAIESYRRTIELNPEDPVALRDGSWLAATQRGDAEEALQWAQRLRRLEPEAWTSWATEAAALAANGERAAAVEAIDRALESAPESERAELQRQRARYGTSNSP